MINSAARESSMQIYTHPNNSVYLEQIMGEAHSKMDGWRPAKLSGLDVIYSEAVPELCDSKTDFISQADDRFTEFPTSSPATWEVYFGFVKPVKVPNFIMADMHRYTMQSRGFYLVGSLDEI